MEAGMETLSPRLPILFLLLPRERPYLSFWTICIRRGGAASGSANPDGQRTHYGAPRFSVLACFYSGRGHSCPRYSFQNRNADRRPGGQECPRSGSAPYGTVNRAATVSKNWEAPGVRPETSDKTPIVIPNAAKDPTRPGPAQPAGFFAALLMNSPSLSS